MSYKHTILHVDADDLARQIIDERLEALGYDITAIGDPARAMQEVVNSHQRLVLLDIEMPGINGLQLLKDIKHNDGSTQVIVLTGIATMQTVLQSFRWGAEYCFFKPIKDFDSLAQAIEKTFWKIDQWWSTVEELTKQRRLAKAAAAEKLTKQRHPAETAAAEELPTQKCFVRAEHGVESDIELV